MDKQVDKVATIYSAGTLLSRRVTKHRPPPRLGLCPIFASGRQAQRREFSPPRDRAPPQLALVPRIRYKRSLSLRAFQPLSLGDQGMLWDRARLSPKRACAPRRFTLPYHFVAIALDLFRRRRSPSGSRFSPPTIRSSSSPRNSPTPSRSPARRPSPSPISPTSMATSPSWAVFLPRKRRAISPPPRRIFR